MEIALSASRWTHTQLVVLRFFFVYFFLYAFPLGALVMIPQTTLWHGLVVWTGESILHLDYPIATLPGGSGDTTWNYVQVLDIVILSLIATVIWSILDRKRVAYRKLWYWLITGLRFYVGFHLLDYGFAKIIPTQFGYGNVQLYMRSYADSSPMGLLWTFMSYSQGYNFFTGAAEVIGGALLFFNRTRLLGALINIAVMSNVVMLNFTYDVPVKLFSIHLLLMNMLILLPDLSRLIRFLVLNKDVGRQTFERPPMSKKWRTALTWTKVAVLLMLLIVSSQKVIYGYRFAFSKGECPVYGVYEVQDFIVNGELIPPTKGDTKRWKKVVIDWDKFAGKALASLEYMDDATISWEISSDTIARKVMFTQYSGKPSYELLYSRSGALLTLDGKSSNDSIRVVMKQVDTQIPLLARGFHWINEAPYNR